MTSDNSKKASQSSTQPDTLAILSIVFGIVSLMGPGLLLGIPAIVMAAIALKKDAPGRALSITGLVTGIISTVLSLLFIAFIVFIVSWSVGNPDFYNDYYYPHDEQFEESAQQSART